METLLLFIATGTAAGLMAGLFGVGGGLIMVPALVFLLPLSGIAPEIVVKVALGTSLAVIAVTSLSSTRAHHRRDGVLWPVFRALAPGLALGALGGAYVAHATPGALLHKIVGVGALLLAVQMWLDLKPAGDAATLPGTPALFSVGTVIGVLSSLIGIGGGSLTVPFLSWRGVEMRRAVGTAAACGVPIAWAGAAGYVSAGWNVAGRPEPGLGYVSLAAFAGLAVASVLAAPYGAKLAHKLSAPVLRRAFAVLLVATGIALLAG
ncbi:MAG TPA: sulfite exporter TauE/SafE family protein [Verrucomicrobiae bacterium]|nr:sulfite exporter TauE/SafE family protein [Verrucomicrobiae bacterium]